MAKRWVPWLCAYTGARVGEIAQLRKQDVRWVDGHYVIHITPEPGTVKTDEPRDVVLHSHLIQRGSRIFGVVKGWRRQRKGIYFSNLRPPVVSSGLCRV
jgi:integrase